MAGMFFKGKWSMFSYFREPPRSPKQNPRNSTKMVINLLITVMLFSAGLFVLFCFISLINFVEFVLFFTFFKS